MQRLLEALKRRSLLLHTRSDMLGKEMDQDSLTHKVNLASKVPTLKQCQPEQFPATVDNEGLGNKFMPDYLDKRI
ncbi:hypothetical protein Tco_0937196 [Tanacetum coccineum]|uniref:Uncharacterized protein n=1 Tax=Tanacetum coccineum TaxID=301880 RepID=A0ABQ5DDJ5_9ASTR